MDVFRLLGTIAVDNSGAFSAMDDTVDKAKRSENTLAKTFKRIGTAVAAAFTVDKIVDFGKQCVNAYAGIAAQESAFSQIMGDYADTAQQKLNAVADQTGVSSSRLTSAMTSLTAKFKGLGYSVEDATTLASDGLLIASDAAAFWDMSLDESMSHLNSFINGSYEGGEAIGLFANDTQMAAYAVEQGIVKDAKAWAKLDEATKQATRLDYAKRMMEQSGATGQAAKEADAYANVQANLTAAWTKFTGVIGKPIMEKFVLPGMRKLLDFMPGLTDAVTNGINWLSNGLDKIASYFTDVFTESGIKLDALPKALYNMFKDLGKSVSGLLASFGRSLESGWSKTVWPVIQKAFKAAFGIELPDWATVKQKISDGWNNVVWAGIQTFFSKRFNINLPDWATLQKNISDGWTLTVWPAIQDFFTKTFGVNTPDWAALEKSITDGWTNTVWPAVQDFFTKSFGITLPDWATLKQNISDGWTLTVWPSVQDFFTKTFNITLPDWATVKQKIAGGWSLTVWPAVQGFFKRTFNITLPDWETVKQSISGGWTNTILPAIQDFFTKPFNITLPNWDEVKTKISSAWTDIIKPAIAGYFKAVFAIALPVWNTVKTAISTWWTKLVLPAISGLFKAIFGVDVADATGVEVGTKLREWWDKVVKVVGDVFKAIFSVFPEDSDGTTTGQKIKDWWAKAVEFIGNIFRGFFKVDPDDPLSTANKVISWFTGVLKSIGNIFFAIFGIRTEDKDSEGVTWSDKIISWFTGVLAAVGDIFKSLFKIELPDARDVARKVQGWWNGVKSSITLGLSAMWQGVEDGVRDQAAYKGGYGETAGGKGSTLAGTLGAPADVMSSYFGDGSYGIGGIKGFATGLDYVPRDDYLARLHQGEAVLTRKEADAWRKNGFSDTSRLEATLATVAGLLQEVAQNTGAGTQIVLDSGVLVGQLAPGMNAQFGAMSSRKRRQ